MRVPNILTPGLYRLDALKPGDVIETPSRQISDDDIDQFAALSGDYFTIHMDKQAAIEAGFSGRVAHGLFVLSVIDGLKNQSAAQLDAIASLGWDITFSAPVISGDTITASLTISSCRQTSDGKRGVITAEVVAVNQHGITIQQGKNILMVNR